MMYKLRTLQDNMAATTETLTKTQERIGTIHIVRKHCWGALCVEMGFTWTFPRNQDATGKLKSELISIKF